MLHDVAIQKPVLFAIDRAGIVGADGQTHQCAFDLAYLRCIPEMVHVTRAMKTNVARCSIPAITITMARPRCATRVATRSAWN
ncbi:hypothetical protein ACNKHX_02165 [Shigella flexneri]